MDYIKTVSKPKDGKLLAIGHSMGGILLYAMLSREGKIFLSNLFSFFNTTIIHALEQSFS